MNFHSAPPFVLAGGLELTHSPWQACHVKVVSGDTHKGWCCSTAFFMVQNLQPQPSPLGSPMSSYTDWENLLCLLLRQTTHVGSWATTSREFVYGAESLWEDHVYLACSNKLPYRQPPSCWFSEWNLSLTHCHWTCPEPEGNGRKPHRSEAVETALDFAGTNTNKCFHHCVVGSGWPCRKWRLVLWGWLAGRVGSVSSQPPHWTLK